MTTPFSLHAVPRAALLLPQLLVEAVLLHGAAAAGPAGPTPADLRSGADSRMPREAMRREEQPFAIGALVVDSPAHGGPVRLDLGTGKTWPLPQSRLAKNCTSCKDSWFFSKSAGSGVMLRADKNGQLSFFDRSSFAELGGLNPASLPGADLPAYYGPLRVSPDGRMVLGYWKLNYRADQPSLTLLDRAGRVIESGSPFEYSRYLHSDALDWLPNGDYVYLADRRVVVARPGQGVQQVMELSLPPQVSTSNASLLVSPDGQRLLLNLQTQVGDTPMGLLYTIKLDGSDARQITQPSPRARQMGVSTSHANPAWSPDGRFIAFSVRGRNLGLPGGSYRACQPILVLPSSASLWDVDGIEDPASWKLQVPDGAGKLRVLEDCAGLELRWF